MDGRLRAIGIDRSAGDAAPPYSHRQPVLALPCRPKAAPVASIGEAGREGTKRCCAVFDIPSL